MPELADIFRRYGPEYRARFGKRMPPSHLRAMEDIINCRTPQMGGHIYQCEKHAASNTSIATIPAATEAAPSVARTEPSTGCSNRKSF